MNVPRLGQLVRIMLVNKKLCTELTINLQDKYPINTIEALNPECFLYKTFKPEDYRMLIEESHHSYMTIYAFDVSHVSIGATKNCPWCHAAKTKVDDWAEHCLKQHTLFRSADHLRRGFAIYKCQSALYHILTRRLRKNWKQLAVIQEGCIQCTDTETMFDGSRNTEPKRCVRMDTPKSRMVDFSFFEIDIAKFMRKNKFKIGELLDMDKAWIKLDNGDVVLGGIIEWPLK